MLLYIKRFHCNLTLPSKNVSTFSTPKGFVINILFNGVYKMNLKFAKYLVQYAQKINCKNGLQQHNHYLDRYIKCKKNCNIQI